MSDEIPQKAEEVKLEIEPTQQPSSSSHLLRERPWFHPLAALVMMALDFGGVIGDVGGLFLVLLMPFVMVAIFAVTTSIVTFIQIKIEGEEFRDALTKGAVAGVLCAIPMPIFGTAVGGYILVQSGMESFRAGGVQKIWEMFAARKK